MKIIKDNEKKIKKIEKSIIQKIEALKLEDDRTGLKQNALLDKVIEILKEEMK